MVHLRFEAAHEGPVAGLDEAGRGPWAGPVVAAAVVLDPDRVPEGLGDSKTLSPARRARLSARILAEASVGIGLATAREIDRLNILGATFLAMQRAVAALPVQPRAALVDGNRAPRLFCPVTTIVKGDTLSASIAAASIIAKVTRDRMMEEIDRQYPDYGFARHKGYGVKQHDAALAAFGPCAEHRLSFAPVARAAGLRAAAKRASPGHR